MAIGDLIDFSTRELLGKKAFGKKKVIEFYKALAFLASGLWHENESLDPVEKVEGILRDFPGLSNIEREILELRVGKEGLPQTLEKIGSQKKVTRERIRQLEKSGLRKIRTVSNLEAFNQFLTDREKEIWYLLGGVDGTIQESARFDELAESLPFNFRLCIQVYTGSKVTGERFPNVLRAFLSNRYKFANGCWYNVPIDPIELETLVLLLEGELSHDGSVLRLEELKNRISVNDELKVDYALSMSGAISIYRGYCTKRKLTSKTKRLIDLIIIMRGLHAQKRVVSFSDICKTCLSHSPQNASNSRDIGRELVEKPKFFCKVGTLGWILVEQRNEDFSVERLNFPEEDSF